MSVARTLGWAALVLGVAAAFAGDPHHGGLAPTDSVGGSEDASATLPAVSATQLAEWIRRREPGLRVIDLRSTEAFEAFRIPGARHEDPDALDDLVVANSDVLVLVSADGAIATPMAERLRGSGAREVHVLRNGVRGWLDEVMNPVLAVNATPEARRRFEARAELSRYFGGQPRIGAASDQPADTPTRTEDDLDRRVSHLRRRGCG